MATDHQVALIAPLLRRAPIQKRSRNKVRAILTAAEELLAEVGFAATVNNPEQLLERAHVGSASFYSYFASSSHVVQVLGRLYLQESKSVIDIVATQSYPSWEAAAHAIIDAYAAYFRNPIVRPLWLQGLLGKGTMEEHDADAYIAAVSRRIIVRSSGGVIGGTELQHQTAEELATRLLEFSFRHDPQGDAERIEEAKRAYVAYIATFPPDSSWVPQP